jgi:hypothetical protein
MSYDFNIRMSNLCKMLEQEINLLRQKQGADCELVSNLGKIKMNLSSLLFVNDEVKLENLKQDALFLNNQSNVLLSNSSFSYQFIRDELDFITANYQENFAKFNTPTSVPDLDAIIEKMNATTAAVDNKTNPTIPRSFFRNDSINKIDSINKKNEKNITSHNNLKSAK